MTVLIPSYEPDVRLLNLILKLQQYGLGPIVIVDDGSGPAYRGLFESARAYGCTVLTHPRNLGKGRALKTGFRHIRTWDSREGIVCADSDSQHLPDDIRAVAEELRRRPFGSLVLGSRRFTGKVPLRSRFGNSVTRGVFAIATGGTVHDTQTGLRAFPYEMLDWLCDVPGDRFEYEMNMLLAARREGYAIREVTIETVYLEANKSSHFRPLADSLRIYVPIFAFGASSAASALIDFLLLFVLQSLTHHLFFSVAAARLCSSVFNYTVNRKYVFGGANTAQVRRSLPKYFSLALLVLLLNYGLLYFYNEQLILPLVVAKILTEASIFAFSFWMQRRFVY